MKIRSIIVFIVVFAWTNATQTTHHLRQGDYDRYLQSDKLTNTTSKDEVDQMKMFSLTQANGDCAHVCKNSRARSLSFFYPNDGQKSFIELLMKGIRGFINRLCGIAHHNTIHNIPTDTILPYFKNTSRSVKLLVQKLRNESSSTAALFDAPDFIMMMYNFSADNMESLSEVLDPIVDELSQQETIDVGTIGCDLIRLLMFMNYKTLPNIVSMVEVMVTMSNNTQMMKNYSKFSTMWSNRATGSSDGTLNTNNGAVVLQCMEGPESNGEAFVSTVPRALVLPSTQGKCNTYSPLVWTGLLFGSIILFPFSIVVNIASIIIAVILIIGVILFALVQGIFNSISNQNTRQYNYPCDDYPEGIPDDIFTFSKIEIFAFILLGLIASPIILPFVTLFSIGSLLSFVFPLSSNCSSESSKVVLDKLAIVLETPFDSMMNTMQNMLRSNETLSLDDNVDFECEINTLLCKNTALLDALPIG